MMQRTAITTFMVAVASPALGDYQVTQGGSAPAYKDAMLNFDEPGGPTGVIDATYWQDTIGIVIDAGDGVPQVGDYDAVEGGWGLGDANSFFGNFGVFMTFSGDLTGLSIQVWDPAGPPGPFGGGLGVFVFNDGVEVANFFTTPAWGGIGDSWLNVAANAGDVFDEVRILGFGFPATTYADNLSWAYQQTSGYAITQGASAPAYTDRMLNFDEPGGPTGVIDAAYWQDSLGLIIDAGDGVPQVGDYDAVEGGWGLGDGNSFFGNFGVFMMFDHDLTGLSLQVWDPAGPPGPFGGGLGVFVFNDGVEVANFFTTPAWGGIGDPWFDIAAFGDEVFDEVRILGFGFPATTYADNLTWNIGAGPMVMPVDIKPGSCPNSFNRGSNGVLPVALLGTEEIDITLVDIASLELRRADGVGGGVAPNNGPPGPHPTYDDVATPFEGEDCDCHDLGGDGFMDIMMHFRTSEVVSALGLDDQAPGALVPLELHGSLLDGTPFVGSDCVRLVPPGGGESSMAVTSTVPGAWVDVTPLDCTLDGGGFATFTRCYPAGSHVTLVAPPTQDGRVFAGWAVEGQTGLISGTALTIPLAEGELGITAVYHRSTRPILKRPASSTPIDVTSREN